MKVLLVEPPINSSDIATGLIGLAEPLALEIVAASIPQHEVKILDMRLERNLDRALRTFKPHIVGTTCYTIGVRMAKNILKEVKKFDPKIMTVIGGHHVTVKPEDFNDDFTDIVVIGEGEVTFKELVEKFEKGKEIYDIEGIGFSRNGKFIRTPSRPLINLEDMPFPARHLVEKYRRHYFRASWRPIASVVTSRGCPFRCSFCAMWKVNRGRYRTRSAESVVEEIANIREKYIDFCDDNTLGDVSRAEKMYELIKKRGINKIYKIYARADTVADHPELIKKWKEIGMRLILIGFEAFRDKELKNWNKRSTLKKNEEAIRVLKENGVEAAAYFMVDPQYDSRDFKSLSDYVLKKELTQPVFTILTPFPGTDLFEEKKNDINMNYDFLDFYHTLLPTKLPKKEFYQQFAKLYRRSYSLKKFFTKKRGETKAFSFRQFWMWIKFMFRLSLLAKKAKQGEDGS